MAVRPLKTTSGPGAAPLSAANGLAARRDAGGTALQSIKP
jgi:hypothetical protein